MIPTLDIEHEDVMLWLSELEPDTVVHKDTANICGTCLFANYLRSKFKVYPNLEVGYNYINYTPDSELAVENKVPRWVTNAIIIFDNIGSTTGEIYPEQAMEILENLERKYD